MRRVVLAVFAAATMVAATTGVTLATAGIANAQASCTGTTVFRDVTGGLVNIPTVGNDTGQDNCDLGVGNSSGAVVALQFELNDCYGQNLSPDGIFGAQTKAALEHAQSVEHVTVDGVYGPVTRDHLHWADSNAQCERL
jgi:peptidoglycan hydrolase-like protein with peptidoglycan-binding domain